MLLFCADTHMLQGEVQAPPEEVEPAAVVPLIAFDALSWHLGDHAVRHTRVEAAMQMREVGNTDVGVMWGARNVWPYLCCGCGSAGGGLYDVDTG